MDVEGLGFGDRNAMGWDGSGVSEEVSRVSLVWFSLGGSLCVFFSWFPGIANTKSVCLLNHGVWMCMYVYVVSYVDGTSSYYCNPTMTPRFTLLLRILLIFTSLACFWFLRDFSSY